MDRLLTRLDDTSGNKKTLEPCNRNSQSPRNMEVSEYRPQESSAELSPQSSVHHDSHSQNHYSDSRGSSGAENDSNNYISHQNNTMSNFNFEGGGILHQHPILSPILVHNINQHHMEHNLHNNHMSSLCVGAGYEPHSNIRACSSPCDAPLQLSHNLRNNGVHVPPSSLSPVYPSSSASGSPNSSANIVVKADPDYSVKEKCESPRGEMEGSVHIEFSLKQVMDSAKLQIMRIFLASNHIAKDKVEEYSVRWELFYSNTPLTS